MFSFSPDLHPFFKTTLPNASDPPVHDFHHFQNRGNFATSHWDMVFGTNKNWLEWKAKQEARKAQGLAEETERRTDDDDEEEAEKAAVAAS